MRRTLAAFLALACAVPASAQGALDSASALASPGAAAVFDGRKLDKPAAPPVFAGGALSAPPQINLHLDDGRWKARDKGVWLGLGAFIAMEAAWNISYHRKHPWGMGPDSPAYLASWGGVIALPLIGEQIGKAIDRRYERKRRRPGY